jgi:hypothetical protein
VLPPRSAHPRAQARVMMVNYDTTTPGSITASCSGTRRALMRRLPRRQPNRRRPHDNKQGQRPPAHKGRRILSSDIYPILLLLLADAPPPKTRYPPQPMRRSPTVWSKVVLTSLAANTVPDLRLAALTRARLNAEPAATEPDPHPMSAGLRACLHSTWFGFLPSRCLPMQKLFLLLSCDACFALPPPTSKHMSKLSPGLDPREHGNHHCRCSFGTRHMPSYRQENPRRMRLMPKH